MRLLPVVYHVDVGHPEPGALQPDGLLGGQPGGGVLSVHGVTQQGVPNLGQLRPDLQRCLGLS